jgi:lipoprotein Spr
MIKRITIILFFAFAGQVFAGHTIIKKRNKITTQEEAFSFLGAYQIETDSCHLDLYSSVYEWMGTRYKYSGKKGKGGLDCSGFAKIIYRDVYQKELKGGSADIFPKTFALNKEQLAVGDLVFFKIRKSRISHVGIYLGNNKFVHAAVKGGVRIDSLDSPYYKKTFYKGGRL